MKKVFRIFICCIYVSVLFFSCSNDLSVEGGFSSEDSRKEELAMLAASGNYILSEDEMKESLIAFLMAKDTVSRAASTVKNYELTLADEASVSYPATNTGRSISPESMCYATLYLFNVFDKENDSYGYAITSTDKRVGRVLAVIPEGNVNAKDNSFFVFYTKCLENYIEKTAKIWNEIDDDYIRSVCTRAELKGGVERQLAAAPIADYEYSDWIYNSGNTSKLLSTKWGQDYSYNDAIEAVYKKDYLVGCTSVAVAQLLAYYKPPMTIHPTCYSVLKSKYPDIETWNGVYDWQMMTKNPTIYGLSDSAQVQLQALLYEMPERFEATYGTSETSARSVYIDQVIENLGFSTSGIEKYSFDKVKSSIDAYGPLAIYGSAEKKDNYIKVLWKKIKVSTSYYHGHAWVIDGYANFDYKIKNQTTGEIKILKQDFVHCNVGWDGLNDGYYKSGVFDMNNTPLEDSRSAYQYYYQYNIQLIRNLEFTGIYKPVSFGIAAEEYEYE